MAISGVDSFIRMLELRIKRQEEALALSRNELAGALHLRDSSKNQVDAFAVSAPDKGKPR